MAVSKTLTRAETPTDWLTGQDIVCIGSQDWSTHKNVPQQTMGRLASANRILYVEVPRTPWRALAGAGGGYGTREALALSQVQGDRGTLWRYAPPPVFLPANGLPRALAQAAGAANGVALAAMIRRVCKRLNFGDPLLWIYGVSGANLLGRLRARLVIYDCIDEWPGYLTPGTARDSVARLDEALCRRADLVFVGSRNLFERKGRFNAATHFVPHAADFALFRKAGLEETPPADEMRALTHPIIGLAGMLDKRVDIDLLDKLARTHPEWTLALVGPVWENLDITPLQALPNVRFLGRKSVDQLPAYIKAFDVCIVPYRLDDFTRNIYPLKLHEYLASGKPIVSTPVPAIAEHADLVRIADDSLAFLQATEAAIQERDPGLRQRRIQLASENTWEDRVSKKSALVRAML